MVEATRYYGPEKISRTKSFVILCKFIPPSGVYELQ